ncbi:hypothetical protein MASR1M90_07240 [Desulfovibrionales bacterium]
MFSIIVPTFNRAPILQEALTTMLHMDGIADCELIVVDDGSTDETPIMLERLRTRHPGLVRVVRQTNAGPGMARNTGLHVATRDYVLFLDDDVFPEPDLLHAHARFLRQGFDLSQGMLVWDPRLANSWLVRYMDAHGMQFAFDKVTDDHDLPYLYVYTANLAVLREKIMQQGGFDPVFAAKRYAFEDTALAYRLKRMGCRLGLNRAARAVHYHPITPEGLAVREYKVGYALGVLQEHYPDIAAALHVPRLGVLYRAITFGLGMLVSCPAIRFLNEQTRLRLACREAFGRGRIDYEHNHRTA